MASDSSPADAEVDAALNRLPPAPEERDPAQGGVSLVFTPTSTIPANAPPAGATAPDVAAALDRLPRTPEEIAGVPPVDPAKHPETPSAFWQFMESVSPSNRNQELEDAPDWTRMPEASLLSHPIVALGSSITGADKTIDIMRRNYPDMKIEKTDDGYIKFHSKDGNLYTWKPGIRWSDIKRLAEAAAVAEASIAAAGPILGAIGLGGLTTAGTTAATAAATAAGTAAPSLIPAAVTAGVIGATANEGVKAMAGGGFDPSQPVIGGGFGLLGGALNAFRAWRNAPLTNVDAMSLIRQATTEGADGPAARELATRLSVDPAKAAAARGMGVSLSPDLAAMDTPAAQGVVRASQAVKSAASRMGGTGLAEENAVIQELGQNTQDLIPQHGGTIGASGTDRAARDYAATQIGEAKTEASRLFKMIRKRMGARDMETPRFTTWIKEQARVRGGVEELPPKLRELYRRLVPHWRSAVRDANNKLIRKAGMQRPKYAVVDDIRRAMNARGFPATLLDDEFKSQQKFIGGLLTGDAKDAVENAGMGGHLDQANALTRRYKLGQQNVTRLYGPQTSGKTLLNAAGEATKTPVLTGEMLPDFRNSLKGLAQGHVQQFVDDLEAIPAPHRQALATSALDSIFGGTDANGLSAKKFAEVYGKIMKEPEAAAALRSALPAGLPPKLDSVYTLSQAINKVMTYRSNNGMSVNTALAATNRFLGYVLSSLPVVGKGAAGLVGWAAGKALAGPKGAFAGGAMSAAAGDQIGRLAQHFITGAGSVGLVLQDSFLSSPEFRDLVINVAQGIPRTPGWMERFAARPVVQKLANVLRIPAQKIARDTFYRELAQMTAHSDAEHHLTTGGYR